MCPLGQFLSHYGIIFRKPLLTGDRLKVQSQFEKRLPQPEIKCTRRIHLEIRSNLDPRSFTENHFLGKPLLILLHYFVIFG